MSCDVNVMELKFSLIIQQAPPLIYADVLAQI